MLFQPVTDTRNFDAETVKLYSKRASDPRLTERLIQMHRNVDRNNLPVVSNPPTQYELERDSYLKWYPFKVTAAFAFTMWASWQFTKAYFPYGIILRRSIPTSPLQKATQLAPIGICFAYLWYRQREYPRQFRIDLTDPSEN